MNVALCNNKINYTIEKIRFKKSKASGHAEEQLLCSDNNIFR